MRELSRSVQSRSMADTIRNIAFDDIEVILTDNYKDWEYHNVLRTKIMTSHDLGATVVISDDGIIDIEFSGDCVRRGISVRNNYVVLYGDCFAVKQKEIIERITDYLDAKSFFEI